MTTRTVRLRDELDHRLVAAAQRRGAPVSEVLREAIEEKCSEILGTSVREELRDYIGCIASEGPGVARKSGKAFAELLSAKRARRP